MATNLNDVFTSLQLVVFDFDGVFTDNRVFVNQEGIESVICNRSDGLGLSLLKKVNLPSLILSTEKNPVVQMRAKKLGMECHSGCEDKLSRLKELVKARGIDLAEVAYVGNDINDLECMQEVGLPVAVQDAYPVIKKAAKWVLDSSGGQGAVREFCEKVYEVRQKN